LLSRHSIMTEKLARRGTAVRTEYAVDHLAHVLVRDMATEEVVTLRASETLDTVRRWIASGAGGTTHQGFPVLDDDGLLVGVVTRRDLLERTRLGGEKLGNILRRPPVVVYDDSTLRDAADQMVLEHVGRLPVVRRGAPRELVGIVSRSDLLAGHAPRLEAAHRLRRVRTFTMPTSGA